MWPLPKQIAWRRMCLASRWCWLSLLHDAVDRQGVEWNLQSFEKKVGKHASVALLARVTLIESSTWQFTYLVYLLAFSVGIGTGIDQKTMSSWRESRSQEASYVSGFILIGLAFHSFRFICISQISQWIDAALQLDPRLLHWCQWHQLAKCRH